MSATSIYLDYNASAPVRPGARQAALDAIGIGANPSSVHRPGRLARALVERAREDVAGLVDGAPERVVFTSGCSEANALAILGGAGAGLYRRLIVFALEHESAHATARTAAERFGLDLAEIRADPNGTIDLAELDYVLARCSDPALVCVMGANNETGVVQPLVEVGEMCALRGARLHVDAAQIAGRLPFSASAFDFVTLSAHKIGGLQGVGALILGADLEVEPLWGGGAQERRRRPGTEAVAAIAAFGAAARAAAAEIGRAHEHARWRDAMEARLSRAIPGLQVFGGGAQRLPQTSCLGVPGLLAETQLVALDLEGIAVGAGAACSSGKVAPSHVLTAMGAGEDAARAALRVSFGWATREEELVRFAQVWSHVLERSLGVRRAHVSAGA